jgi:hypothetical protein
MTHNMNAPVNSPPLACCPVYLPSPFQLQELNCIGSQKPKSGFYPEPDEYNPHPNPLSFT